MKKTLLLFILILFFNRAGAQNIYDAIVKRNYSSLEQLLKDGVKINKYNSEGNFPLYAATVKNDTIAVKLLLKYGADINQRSKNLPIKINSFEYACQEGFYDLVKFSIRMAQV